MSLTTDYAKLNVEEFGRAVMRHHNALDPFLASPDDPGDASERELVRKALDSLLYELKAQRMRLDWFARQTKNG